MLNEEIKTHHEQEKVAQPQEREDARSEHAKISDTLSRLFLERDTPAVQGQTALKSQQLGDQGHQQDVSQKAQKSQETNKKTDQEQEEDVDKKQTSASSDDSDREVLKREAEKVRQELESTKKWGHSNSQKLKRAIVKTKEFLENGDLSEEEAQALLDILNAPSSSGSSVKEEDEALNIPENKNDHPFAKVFRLANTELDNIRKYTNDDLLDEKVKAFDYFLSVATPQERDEALEDLTDLMDDPVAMTKTMLSLGQSFYDEYKEIQDAGGFRGYRSQKAAEISKLTQKIDKLTKKLAQYEDYDRPTYGLKEMGSSDAKDRQGPLGSIDSLLEQRDRAYARR